MNGSVNKNIKNFRKFKNITQQQLADACQKSKNVVSNWERGDNSPDIDCVEIICKVLGVTPNQLFGWEPYPAYENYINLMTEKRSQLQDLENKKSELQDQIDTIYSEIKIEEDKWRNN